MATETKKKRIINNNSTHIGIKNIVDDYLCDAMTLKFIRNLSVCTDTLLLVT